MNILLVYDSIFGCTADVAKIIADELRSIGHHVVMQEVHEAQRNPLVRHDLLIVGSPTRGFLPTPGMREFIASLAPPVRPIPAVAFDTRLDLASLSRRHQWAVDIGGYAATRLAQELRAKGYEVRAECGFFVTGLMGPLRAGEAERATVWASELTSV